MRKNNRIFLYSLLSIFASLFFVSDIYASSNKIIKFDNLNKTCNIYEQANTNTILTYIHPQYQNDVPLLASSGNFYKIKISGVVGWINKNDCTGTIVDVDNIGKYSYKTGNVTLSGLDVSRYQVDENKLYFALVQSDKDKYYKTITLGYTNVPKGLYNKKVYYSYDGVYYYSSYHTMMSDYKNNTYKNAANYKYPYYDYYQYLPLRSKTSISSNSFNNYLISKKPDASQIINVSNVFNTTCPPDTPNEITLSYSGTKSILYNKGSIFLDNQKTNNVNASVLYGISLNESEDGMSNLAIYYKNPFGWEAFDSCPNSAKIYTSIDEAIKKYFENMSNQYANPIDWRGGMGTHLGNKRSGMNVKYASDPHWGYKAAYNYRRLDEKSSNKDKNKYVTGIVNPTLPSINTQINLYSQPNLSSPKTSWYYDRNGFSLILLGESNGFYKVQDDTKPITTPIYVKKENVKVTNNIYTYKVYKEYNSSGSLINKTTYTYKYRLLYKKTVKKYSKGTIYVKYEYYYVNQKLISTNDKKAIRYKTLYKYGKAYVTYRQYYSTTGELLSAVKVTLRK